MARKKLEWYQRLRKARKDMELTLEGATKLLYEQHKIYMHPKNLRKVEVGESNIPVTKFRSLCDIYSVSADEILGLKIDKDTQ